MHLIKSYTPEILKLCVTFEECHPKELQWPENYKIAYLNDEETHAYWLADDQNNIVGEALFHHKSDSCVEIDSYTVLTEHRGKGFGKKLVELGITEVKSMGYEYLMGEARDGASIKTFLSMGAEIVCPQKNWGGTNETFYTFKLDLK